jgi:hypothetical protein
MEWFIDYRRKNLTFFYSINQYQFFKIIVESHWAFYFFYGSVSTVKAKSNIN